AGGRERTARGRGRARGDARRRGRARGDAGRLAERPLPGARRPPPPRPAPRLPHAARAGRDAVVIAAPSVADVAIVPDLVGIIQAIVRDRLASLRVAEIGVVTAVFPHESDGDKSNYECAVRLRDSGLDLPR